MTGHSGLPLTYCPVGKVAGRCGLTSGVEADVEPGACLSTRVGRVFEAGAPPRFRARDSPRLLPPEPLEDPGKHTAGCRGVEFFNNDTGVTEKAGSDPV